MSNYDWAEYPQPCYDNAGLEVQQQNQAHLPNAPVPAQLSAPLPYAQEKPSKTICGIPKKAFWTLVVVAIAVILAGIGGGLAARFAGQHKTQNPPQNPVGASIQLISSTTASLQPPNPSPTVLITTIQTILTLTLSSSAPLSFSNPCTATSAFTSSLFWMGTESGYNISPPQVLWYFGLNSAQACCEKCFALPNIGANGLCNVWGYFPLPYGAYANNRDSCAVVWGYEGNNKDNVCTAGRPDIGLLKPTGRQTKDGNGIGAPGLCFGNIYTYTTAGQ